MALHLDTLIRPLRPATRWENSGPIDVDSLRGRPVLVHFWSVSCRSCKAQMDQVNAWHNEFGDRLAFIGVHTPLSVEDMNDDRVLDAIHALELRHPVALDGDDGALADIYQVQLTPAYYLFDANGRLRLYFAGEEALEPVRRAIERVLGIAPEQPATQGPGAHVHH